MTPTINNNKTSINIYNNKMKKNKINNLKESSKCSKWSEYCKNTKQQTTMGLKAKKKRRWMTI